MVKRMLQFCYGKGYSNEKAANGDPLWCSSIHTHAEMYVLADKFEMEGLKSLAKNGFLAVMTWWMGNDNNKLMPSIHRLVSSVYTGIPESDSMLRKSLVRYVQAKWKILSGDPDIKIAIAENPDFAFDIIDSKPLVVIEKAAVEKPKPLYTGSCTFCGKYSDKWKCCRVKCDCGRWEEITPIRANAAE